MAKRNWRELLTVYILLFFGGYLLDYTAESMNMGVYKFAVILPFFALISSGLMTYYQERLILIKIYSLYCVLMLFVSYLMPAVLMPAVIIAELSAYHIFSKDGSIKSVFSAHMIAMISLWLALTFSAIFETNGYLKTITLQEMINVILLTAIFALIAAILGDVLGIRVKMMLEKRRG